MKMTYTIKEFADRVGKSPNLIYRRLTERPRRYIVRFARKEGERWVFDANKVEAAIEEQESLITKTKPEELVDEDTARSYFKNGFRPCGKE